MEEEITISQFMSTQVACITPESSLAVAVRTMRQHGYSCVVVTRDETPLGLLTERDLVRLFSDHLESDGGLLECTVEECMSCPPVTVCDSTGLFESLVIARARRIRHLPVVNQQGRLAGIATQSDMVSAYIHFIEKQREIIEKSVTARTQSLLQANEQLKALSLEDALLGVGNRRAMEVDLEHTHATALRYRRPYAVVLFDIDHFKQYNDHYGHPAGDAALIRVSDYLQATIRKADRLYRYGGEEMLLLLPETPLEGAHIMASRLIEGLAKLKLPHIKSAHQVITLSGGINVLGVGENRAANWQEVVQGADEDLYLAKRSGRNRLGAEKK